MTILKEMIVVSRPPAEVFAYICDFTTTVEWDATAIRAKKLTPGPIAPGTQFRVVCALPLGSVSINYTVEKLTPDNLIVLQGQSRFFSVRDQITITECPGGSQIDYQASFEYPPPLRVLASRFRPGLERMGRKAVAGLRAALDDKFPIPRAPVKTNGCDKWGVLSLVAFSRLGYARRSKYFNPVSAPVIGKHIVLTGATSGLGYATALELARRGAELTLVARHRAKASRVAKAIAKATGNQAISTEIADLSLMTEVDQLAARLVNRGRAVDVLINNAGALFNPRGETAEGLEQSHALLLLSPFRLTERLKPLLLKAPSARVINVVSGGMYSQKLKVDALGNHTSAERYSGSAAYAREKRALMVVTEELARRWMEDGKEGEAGIVVNAMHPGWADTPGVRDALPGFYKTARPILRTPQQGADTIVWLAVAPEAGEVSGQLFLDRQIRSTHLSTRTIETGAEREKLMLTLGGSLDKTRSD